MYVWCIHVCMYGSACACVWWMFECSWNSCRENKTICINTKYLRVCDICIRTTICVYVCMTELFVFKILVEETNLNLQSGFMCVCSYPYVRVPMIVSAHTHVCLHMHRYIQTYPQCIHVHMHACIYRHAYNLEV